MQVIETKNSRGRMFRVIMEQMFDGADYYDGYNYEWKLPSDDYWHTGESWHDENKHDIPVKVLQWLSTFEITV